MARFFGQNFKICFVPLLMKDNDEIKKNMGLYRISCIYKKLLPQKPPSQRLGSGAKGRISGDLHFGLRESLLLYNENKWSLIVENIVPKCYFSYLLSNHVLLEFEMYKNNPKLAQIVLKFDQLTLEY